MATELSKLKVDLDDVVEALGLDPMMEMNAYFDLETGEVAIISQEEDSIVESFYEEFADLECEEPLDLAALLAESDYPKLQHDRIILADQIASGFGKRFIRIPLEDTRANFGDMETFVATVENQRFRAKLQKALDGRQPFRTFRDVMDTERRTRERWLAFCREREREQAREWLESVGIEAVHTPKYVPEAQPSGPTPRQKLLDEVLWFTTEASQVAGVKRIALIGSLTTDEPDPNDADLLVTIDDEMDLEPLATLGRKLAGHAQNFNRGGEVFLADEDGNYLGRTCRWKECVPGIRVRCEAQNCGQRHYLYDDLQNLRLRKGLVEKPPVELWPEVVTRRDVPTDLQETVLAHL